MRSRMHSLAALLLLAVPAVMVLAQTKSETGATICSRDLKVDKEKLAAWLLTAHPVSTAYLSVGDHPAPLSSHRTLITWLLKKRAAEKAGGGNACSGDSCHVDRLTVDLQNLLDGKDPQFKSGSDAVAVDKFFASENQNVLTCLRADAHPSLPQTPSASIAASALPAEEVRSSWRDAMRVRGNPDQLSIDRSDQAGYASVERAHLTLANDDVARTRTNDIVLFTGYSFDKRSIGDGASTYEAVPYIGFKQNRVTTYESGAISEDMTRTSQIGILSAFHIAHPGRSYTEDWTARPDYLINSSDGSRLITVNFTYTLVRPGVLNDFIRWSNGMAFKPILIGQSRNGIYANRGEASVYDQHHDFIRLGAQAGFTLVSGSPALPFDFTATFTSLKALQGERSIHYWKAALNYNLNQNIGLSLNYSNGLLPDTADAERKWGLGISSKF